MGRRTGCSLTSSIESEKTGPESAGTRISAGRVGRPHGLDGGFYVTGARARLLAVGAPVRLGDRRLSIEWRGGTDERPILRLGGVEDRDAVAALRGLEIEVSVEQAPALGKGEWWAHQLEGCLVADGERVLGSVARLIEPALLRGARSPARAGGGAARADGQRRDPQGGRRGPADRGGSGVPGGAGMSAAGAVKEAWMASFRLGGASWMEAQ